MSWLEKIGYWLDVRGLCRFVAAGLMLYGVGFVAASNDSENIILPEHLGPVVISSNVPENGVLQDTATPWQPVMAPLLERSSVPLLEHIGPRIDVRSDKEFFYAPLPYMSPPTKRTLSAEEAAPTLPKSTQLDKVTPVTRVPAKILSVDTRPEMPRIAILIDDLGYSRQGMEASLALPPEVALAILPATPFALKTALTAQQQNRITLLHAPMENLRKLKLGPGGLYAEMSESELKDTLKESLDSLPGVQGANNHMGSLLTTNATSMKWVMEILQSRSLFFIDSLTSPQSVAKQTAQEFGLKTISRDVFLDNIRTEQAIDRQFSRLLKLARLHGSALAIGHPYPETTDYLKKRLNTLEVEGIKLVPLSDLLSVSE